MKPKILTFFGGALRPAAPSALLALVLFSLSPVQAGTFTWTGNGPNSNWSTGTNWQGNIAPSPGNGDDIIFSGSADTNATPDVWGWNAGSITFTHAADTYTLGSGGLNLGAGGINNQSSHLQTFAHQITLAADQTWNAGNGDLAFTSGYLNANNRSLTLQGSGSIAITPQLANLNTLHLEGTGDRSFANSISANTVTVSNSGTNTFSGQINANTVSVTDGETTFGSVQAGNGGIHVSGTADVTFAGPISGNSGGIHISTDGNVLISGVIDNGALTINGNGTTTITGQSNSGSPVVVNGGTLILNHSGGTALNSSLTVNDGGIVIFEQDNQIPHDQTVTLNSGATLLLNGTAQLFANLDINGDVTIDFGQGKSELNIQDWGNISIENGITITIVNWSEDDIFSGSDPGENVVRVQYADSQGNIYASGTWGENLIYPDAAPMDYSPVPEPSEYALIMLGGTFFFVFSRRGLAWLLKRRRPDAVAAP